VIAEANEEGSVVLGFATLMSVIRIVWPAKFVDVKECVIVAVLPVELQAKV
jgi:hypothetical protein